MEKLTAKVRALDTKMLKEVANLLMDNFKTGTDLAFEVVMAELEDRMPEEEYVEFCDNL